MSLQNATTATPPPPPASDIPPLPTPSSGWRTLDRTTQAAIVACVLTVPLFLGLVAGPLLLGRGAVEGGPERGLFDAIPIPADAPSTDSFVTIDPINRSTEREAVRVQDRMDQQAIGDTVVHVGNSVSALGLTEIYRWETSQATNGAPGPAGMRCVGTIAGTSTSSSCTDDTAEPTSLSWGEHSDSDLEFNTAFVWNAPTEAKWLVVETSTGHVVTSNVASGVGYAEWEGSERPALHVSLLDTSHNVVWEQFIN